MWYDDHGYARAAAEYERERERACEPCEPTIVRAQKEYEPDGYSLNYIYNCEECFETECEYWKEYNRSEDELD